MNTTLAEIKKSYTRAKASKRFYNYSEANCFFNDLTREVVLALYDYLKTDTVQIEKFVRKMIDDFEIIGENKDDSSGCAMEYLGELSKLWAAVWKAMPDKRKAELPEMVGSYYQNHSNIGMFILTDFLELLDTEGLEKLKRALLATKDYYGFRQFAEYCGDPDSYLLAIKQSGNKHADDELRLAALYIRNKRYAEALDCIKNTPPVSGYEDCDCNRTGLLIEALDGMGDKEAAQAERRRSLLETFDYKMYEEYMKNVAPESYDDEAANISGELAKTSPGRQLWELLADLRKWELLAQSVEEHIDEVDVHYNALRPLSDKLARAGFFRAASLSRRNLVEQCLYRGQNKYYRYAVSDYNKAMVYGAAVENWGKIRNMQEWQGWLLSVHGKKTSFWNLL